MTVINLATETSEAFFWFLPLVIFAGAAVAFGAFIASLSDGDNLVIVGPKAAGKTTLHNYFRKLENSGQTAGVDDVEGCIITVNGKTVRINKGKDIGGSIDLMNNGQQNKLISEANYLIFVFSSVNYMNDNNYRRDVFARLSYCIKLATKTTNILLIASYIDKLNIENPKDKIIELSNNSYDTEIKKYFTQQLVCMNLTDRKKRDELKEKLFK